MFLRQRADRMTKGSKMMTRVPTANLAAAPATCAATARQAPIWHPSVSPNMTYAADRSFARFAKLREFLRRQATCSPCGSACNAIRWGDLAADPIDNTFCVQRIAELVLDVLSAGIGVEMIAVRTYPRLLGIDFKEDRCFVQAAMSIL